MRFGAKEVRKWRRRNEEDEAEKVKAKETKIGLNANYFPYLIFSFSFAFLSPNHWPNIAILSKSHWSMVNSKFKMNSQPKMLTLAHKDSN